jgi:hypothetical protein
MVRLRIRIVFITKAGLPPGFSICVAFKRTLRLKPEVFRDNELPRCRAYGVSALELVDKECVLGRSGV